jgi:hypothetical protein
MRPDAQWLLLGEPRFGVSFRGSDLRDDRGAPRPQRLASPHGGLGLKDQSAHRWQDAVDAVGLEPYECLLVASRTTDDELDDPAIRRVAANMLENADPSHRRLDRVADTTPQHPDRLAERREHVVGNDTDVRRKTRKRAPWTCLKRAKKAPPVGSGGVTPT